MNETMLLAADSMAPYEMASPRHAIDEDSSHHANAGLQDASHDEVKQCPVCKSHVFADMDTCYECMYLFGSKPELEASSSEEDEASEAPVLDEPVAASPLPKAAMTFGGGCKEEDTPCSAEAKAPGEDEDLLAELLVELHGFLGEFLLKRGIDVKKL